MGRRKLAKQAEAGLFGGILDTIDTKYMNAGTGVPLIIEEIFAQLEATGMETSNLFHSPGDVERIKQLQSIYEEARSSELDLSAENVHDLCALVIHYLQSFPEPLCTLLLYVDFIEAHQTNQEDQSEWLQKIAELFVALPELNRRLFTRILEFFELVATTESNEISRSYLVRLIGPLLFYDQLDANEEDGEKVKMRYDADIVFDMLSQILQHHKSLFPVPLVELPPWESTRKEKKKPKHEENHSSSSKIEDDGTLSPGMPASGSVSPSVKRKSKGKLQILKGGFTKFSSFGGKTELPLTAPPGTRPVNYLSSLPRFIAGDGKEETETTPTPTAIPSGAIPAPVPVAIPAGAIPDPSI